MYCYSYKIKGTHEHVKKYTEENVTKHTELSTIQNTFASNNTNILSENHIQRVQIILGEYFYRVIREKSARSYSYRKQIYA